MNMEERLKAAIIYIYPQATDKLAFTEAVLTKLQKMQAEVQVFSISDYCNEQLLDMTTKKLAVSSSDVVKIFDHLYEKTQAEGNDAYIVPITDWHILNKIKKSYLQITNKHVLFCLPKVSEQDKDEFISLVKYMDRFRNIHIALIQGLFQDKMYNLHYLEQEELKDILRLHINQKRKYIGWRHHVNELRQKIKFHKDLFKHKLLVKMHNPYQEKMDRKKPIPKIIHYCWFGGEMPEKVQRCIASWKKAMPECELKCWNESNFPFEKYPFAQEALANKKWAFISDVARLHALYYEGGIYFDTDLELLKPLDKFLNDDGFTSYESLNLIAMAAIGFKQYHPWIGQMLLWYQIVHCDDDYTEIANTKIVSKITRLLYGVKLKGQEQVLPCGLHIYPREYFSPEVEKDKWLVTKKTYCIHHFTGMW